MKQLLKLSKTNSSEAYLTFYLEDDDTLVFKWRGFVTVDLVILAHKKSLDLIRTNGVKKIIEDVKDFTGPFRDANDWFIESYAPSIKALGVRQTAVILSSNIFTQLTINQLKENPDFKRVGISYRVFESTEDAKKWFAELASSIS